MSEIGAFEAKTHLASLLERVERGEEFTITRHGKPVAKLVPAGKVNRKRVQEAVSQMLEFSKGRKLGAVKVKDLIGKGRR